MTTKPIEDAEFRKLYGAYAEQLPLKIGEIESLWALAAEGGNSADLQLLNRALHSLAGSGGTFGHPELGRCAKALEQVVEELSGDVARIQAILKSASPLLESLKRAALLADGRFE